MSSRQESLRCREHRENPDLTPVEMPADVVDHPPTLQDMVRRAVGDMAARAYLGARMDEDDPEFDDLPEGFGPDAEFGPGYQYDPDEDVPRGTQPEAPPEAPPAVEEAEGDSELDSRPAPDSPS